MRLGPRTIRHTKYALCNRVAHRGLEEDGADGGGRTHTLLRVPDFESSASANSATSATVLYQRVTEKRRTRKNTLVYRLCIPHILGMPDEQMPTDPAPKAQRQSRMSKDGNWMSFPKVPNLLQYVGSGKYYARVKINGKIFRSSLETDVFTTAKTKLLDFVRAQRTKKDQVSVMTFGVARKLFEKQLDQDPQLKPQSRQYRRWCLRKIELSWPELDSLPLNEITPEACREWASKLSTEIACHYYNNTIATLRMVVDTGLAEHKREHGEKLENPASVLSRVRITQKQLELPEPKLFRELVANVAKSSGGWGPRDADLVEFLAFTGMRAFSEAQWVTWEDVDWTRHEIIVRGAPETGTKNGQVRRIPILPDMEKLLTKLKPPGNASGRILQVRKCQGALPRACSELGIPRITHHDLRHLFATRCIESGVDIPTVSRWLGHKDGGALAMRTYGHLRNEHSKEMAAKVKF